MGDLLLDGIQVAASSTIPLTEWRRLVRDGAAKIEIVGFSHVFVPTAFDSESVTDFSEVSRIPAGGQMVLGRPELKALLEIYAASGSTHRLLTSIDPIYGKMPSPYRGDGLNAGKHNTSRASPADRSCNSGETGSGKEAPIPIEEEKAAPVPPPTVASLTVASVIERHISTGGLAATEPDEKWLADTALMTRSAVQQLGFQAKLIDKKLTPNAAILRFSGSANITVEQVLKRRSELLTTHKLEIISVRPEPGAIAIFVARSERQIVDIQSLWQRWNPTVSPTGAQSILVGVREDDNDLFFLSPGQRHAPHTLIAGSTGSGKSVLMQSIILGIAATNDPRHARIVLIDPKQGVDYFAFDGLPHLEGGIAGLSVRHVRGLPEVPHPGGK